MSADDPKKLVIVVRLVYLGYLYPVCKVLYISTLLTYID